MTEDELVDYFNEHVLYELLMVRYSRLRLDSGPQVVWNATFAAFNVSARNLYNFLKNKGGRNQVIVEDFKNFYGKFRTTAVSDIQGTLQLMNQQCFHFGRERPKVSGDKVTLKRIAVVFGWVDSNMRHLLESFDSRFRSRITVERANPSPEQAASVALARDPGESASATNKIEVTSTGQLLYEDPKQ